MAGWPLFVYPKYFCSQNKPAERRSHPPNVSYRQIIRRQIQSAKQQTSGEKCNSLIHL
jgi:hypothetical protein